MTKLDKTSRQMMQKLQNKIKWQNFKTNDSKNFKTKWNDKTSRQMTQKTLKQNEVTKLEDIRLKNNLETKWNEKTDKTSRQTSQNTSKQNQMTKLYKTSRQTTQKT